MTYTKYWKRYECSFCKKQYKYNKSYNKHLNTVHKKEMDIIRKTPIDIIASINREWAMKEIEEEAKAWISDPRLRHSFKNGMMPT